MIQRLKKRRDFLAAAKGFRAPRRAFVLESRQRDDDGPARVGFTVSKRVSKKAVERNRIRRRLREAVRQVAPQRALSGHDYVLVGRRSALTEKFGNIVTELAGAMAPRLKGPAGAAAKAASESR